MITVTTKKTLAILFCIGLFILLDSSRVNATVDETPDWTRYDNKEIGVSFDYPEYYDIIDWGTEKLPQLIFMSSGGLDNPDFGIFSFMVYPNNMTLESFLDKQLNNDDGVGRMTLIGNPSQIRISDDVSGMKYEASNEVVTGVIYRDVIFNTYDYIFDFGHVDSKNSNNNIFDQLIKSIELE